MSPQLPVVVVRMHIIAYRNELSKYKVALLYSSRKLTVLPMC